VLVARHDGANSAPASTSGADAQPIITLVADGPAGTMPDLHGLSAREAIRKIVTLGLNARVSGDGFVISQDPAAGTTIEVDDVCRLVLERAPSRRPADVVHP
jgi:beta-lactam-binding protein with PASTA domain